MLSDVFLEHNEELFAIVDALNPGFWTDLGGELQRVRNEQVTSCTRVPATRRGRDANRRQRPEGLDADPRRHTRDCDTNARPGWNGHDANRVRRAECGHADGTRAGIPGEVLKQIIGGREGPLRSPVRSSLRSLAALEDASREPPTFEEAPEGCWNCGSPLHRNRECSR